MCSSIGTKSSVAGTSLFSIEGLEQGKRWMKFPVVLWEQGEMDGWGWLERFIGTCAAIMGELYVDLKENVGIRRGEGGNCVIKQFATKRFVRSMMWCLS